MVALGREESKLKRVVIRAAAFLFAKTVALIMPERCDFMFWWSVRPAAVAAKLQWQAITREPARRLPRPDEELDITWYRDGQLGVIQPV